MMDDHNRQLLGLDEYHKELSRILREGGVGISMVRLLPDLNGKKLEEGQNA